MRRLATLVAATALAAACAPAHAPSSRVDLIKHLLPSTVQLRAEREGGHRRAASGVVVAGDARTRRAWIVTARHFVDPPVPQRIVVRRAGQQHAVPASIRLLSPDHDLALLEVSDVDLVAARLRTSAALGEEVWVIAFPWGGRLTVANGVVSQVVSAEGGPAVEGAPRMVDVSVSYGSSGGGVFAATTGELLGVIESYRTAKVTLPDAPSRALELPVPGETTIIGVAAIRRLLEAAGLPGTAR